ncbi:receptor expression-enhancing protein 5 [Cyclospora cayetanensis]|uniref:Receptor expression-enhancing protein 5 n=1 Tax=Cyclospora cayetanensis TaxID=88456 RepID=A0A6P6S3F4_9EIME|nr:receptor expression-enhancing protein 5 [Cyclospora cayetanensis]
MTGLKKALGMDAAARGSPDSGASRENRGTGEKPQGASAAIQRFFSDADKYFEDTPLAQQASALTGLRPSAIVTGLGVFLLISLGTGLGGGIVCDIAGFLYPAWMSFRAIESPGTEDDKLWLTYWVVYAAFSIAEYFVDIILFWGAEVVYNVFIRPFLLVHQEPIDAYMDKLGEAGTRAAEGIQHVVHEGFTKVHQAVGAVRRKAN